MTIIAFLITPLASTDHDIITTTTRDSILIIEEIESMKPLHYTLPLLLSRSFTSLIRNPTLSLTRVSQASFYGLILCCFFAPISHDQTSVQDRIGSLFELTALSFIGMLGCIAIFPIERNIFYREYIDGDYSVLAFFCSYFLVTIPFIIISALLFSLFMCYLIGLQPSASAFIIFVYIITCFIFVGEGKQVSDSIVYCE